MDSSFVFMLFGFSMFVLVIGLLIFEHKNIKVFALITPSIISIIIFGAIFINDYDTVSSREIDIGLSILGIAVSVWVGLNIYNVLQKDEVDKLEEKVKKLELKSDNINFTMETNLKTLEEKIAYAKIEINYLNTANTNHIANKEKLYKEILDLVDKYPQIIDNEYLSQIYLDYATHRYFIAKKDDEILIDTLNLLDKALELTRNHLRISEIHWIYSKYVFNNKNNIDLAYYHANIAYLEDPCNDKNIHFFMRILASKNTESSLNSLIPIAKAEASKYCGSDVDVSDILKDYYESFSPEYKEKFKSFLY